MLQVGDVWCLEKKVNGCGYGFLEGGRDEVRGNRRCKPPRGGVIRIYLREGEYSHREGWVASNLILQGC